MILRLRRRHLRTAAALAVLAPAAFAAALLARRAVPETSPLPPALEETPPALSQILVDEPGLWEAISLTTRLGRDADGAGLVLEIVAATAIEEPDVLLYWVAADDTSASGIPQDAWLLGALAGTGSRRFALPEPAREGGGTLVLYSLAHRRRVSSATLPPVPAPGD